MASTKFSAFLSLLLVFASGIGVGLVGYRAYTKKIDVAPAPVSPDVLRKQRIDETTREVKLTPEQVTKLEQIYDETRERFREIHDAEQKDQQEKFQELRDDQQRKIKAFLSPEQQMLYDNLRARREAQHEKDLEKKRANHKGGPAPGVKIDH